MDLAKAYDCIPHNLLIAKLEEYRLVKIALSFLLDYLKKHSQIAIIRSSPSQMFFKINVLRNFTIFTGNHLCLSLFLIKLQTSRSDTGAFLLIQRNCYKQLFIEHLRWLLLHNQDSVFTLFNIVKFHCLAQATCRFSQVFCQLVYILPN